MKLNSILCEAIDVKTESGTCIGIAKIHQGEKFILDGRTPDGEGICANAFCSLSNAAFIMMSTEDKPKGKEGKIERVCPHGIVTFQMSRTKEEKTKPYVEK